jgi:exonuclease SbcD
MRFIHAADLHIDSPMRGLSAYEGAPVDELRGASRKAFRNLAQTALDEEVDLVVLAGDVFDGDWPDYNTGLFFIKTLTELTRAGIKVVVLAGNHDAESKLTRHLSLPDGAFKFAHDACETIQPEVLGLDIAVHGQSYATRDVVANLATGYRPAVPGVLNIGVLHTALNGRPEHDSYAPCTVDDLRAKGYDYWALGHVHEREIVADDPWIVFPGNLQGRHARELGPKGFTMVTTEEGRVTGVAHRDADVARWARCAIDASEATRRYEVLDMVRDGLERCAAKADGRLLAVRVVIDGATGVHDQLHHDREAFDAEVRSRAFELGEVWVEKVKLETCRPADLIDLRRRDDAIGALLGAIDDLRSDPDTLVEQYAATFDKLRAKLPAAAIGDGLDPTDPAVLARALDAAAAHIAALLAEGSAA